MKIEIDISKEAFQRVIKKAQVWFSKLDFIDALFIISVLFISTVAFTSHVNNNKRDIEQAEARTERAAEEKIRDAQIGQRECDNLTRLGYVVENCPGYNPWHHENQEGSVTVHYFVGDVSGGYIFRVSNSGSSSETIVTDGGNLTISAGETKYLLQKYQLPEPQIILSSPSPAPATSTSTRQPTRIRVPNPDYSWIECTLVGGPNSAWPQCAKTIEIIVP
jgi:hypothetical protein